MKKQYCLEWQNKKGSSGWKSIGYDCPNEAIFQKKNISAKISLNITNY